MSEPGIEPWACKRCGWRTNKQGIKLGIAFPVCTRCNTLDDSAAPPAAPPAPDVYAREAGKKYATDGIAPDPTPAPERCHEVDCPHHSHGPKSAQPAPDIYAREAGKKYATDGIAPAPDDLVFLLRTGCPGYECPEERNQAAAEIVALRERIAELERDIAAIGPDNEVLRLRAERAEAEVARLTQERNGRVMAFEEAKARLTQERDGLRDGQRHLLSKVADNAKLREQVADYGRLNAQLVQSELRYSRELDKAEADNAKLRRALKSIDDTAKGWPAAGTTCGDIARNALHAALGDKP